jgi:hypothetical protein
MPEQIDIRSIVSRWPSREAMAQDARSKSVFVVHRWWQRRSIPGDRDVDLIAGAKKRGFYLTHEELAQARATERERKLKEKKAARAAAKRKDAA